MMCFGPVTSLPFSIFSFNFPNRQHFWIAIKNVATTKPQNLTPAPQLKRHEHFTPQNFVRLW